VAFAQKPQVKNNPEYDEKLLHFGYTLGFNVMDFKIGHNDLYYHIDKTTGDETFNAIPSNQTLHAEFTNFTPGFQVGMITDLRLGEYFNLRCLPSFIFGQRNVSYFLLREGIQKADTLYKTLKLESSIIAVPIYIKYKAKRINNYRPYLITGTNFLYDLAPKSKPKVEDGEYVLLNHFDIQYEIGFGIDYYFQFFKFSTEIKLGVGLLDMLNHKVAPKPFDGYANTISRLNSRIIMFSLHFE
jgi:hypothetical protein